MDLRHAARVVLGCLAFVGVVLALALPIIHESCEISSEDPLAGGGELTVSSGEGANFSVLAPVYVNAGLELPAEGAVRGELVWWGGCGKLIDCEPCPPSIVRGVNASEALAGAILVVDYSSDERAAMCGRNRFARGLATLGLAALVDTTLAYEHNSLHVPGNMRKVYRLGERRDAEPHGGDGGIPFPQVEVSAYPLGATLRALERGARVDGSLTRTRRNVWTAAYCGGWLPFQIVAVISHVMIIERAGCHVIWHVSMTGARVDLAQLNLLCQIMSHLLWAFVRVDPYFSFHFGFAPQTVEMAARGSAFLLLCAAVVLVAVYWSEMIANDGLATFACESRLSKAVAGLTLLVVLSAVGFVTFEWSSERDAWLAWRVPYMNGHNFRGYLAIVMLPLVCCALGFVISARRVHGYMQQHGNREHLRLLMQRVRLMGWVLLFTISMLVAAHALLFHPTGYVFITVGGSMTQVAVSWILISVTAPPRELVGDGPLLVFILFALEAGLALFRRARARLGAPASDALVHRKSNKIYVASRSPRTNWQDELAPWKRYGVTVALLESVVRTHGINDYMTTQQVCELIIKPATAVRQCCFVDLFVDELGAPEDASLLAAPRWFVSHWWGYPFAQLVAMLRAHDEQLVAAGGAPAAYHFDLMVLNQHGLHASSDHGARLIEAVRKSVTACGNLLLCCSAGPSGLPGWEYPAPIERIWCLYETFVAIVNHVPITVQFGSDDALEFRSAMLRDGMKRVQQALGALDARNANASVPTDCDMILSQIASTTGMERFNERVREGLLAEFKRISRSGLG